jgi:hypothetical protein
VLSKASPPCHDCDPSSYAIITRHEVLLAAAFWGAVALIVLVLLGLLARRFWRRLMSDLDSV